MALALCGAKNEFRPFCELGRHGNPCVFQSELIHEGLYLEEFSRLFSFQKRLGAKKKRWENPAFEDRTIK
jgi:hypothetical protein